MQTKKIEFADSVVQVVQDVCKLVFNLKSNEEVEQTFGINHEQLQVVIKKIINALPDELFVKTSSHVLDEIKHICAREFIFFQVQEKWTDPNYQQDLTNFINIFKRDIQNRVVTVNNHS